LLKEYETISIAVETRRNKTVGGEATITKARPCFNQMTYYQQT
jgi:hypothetical protein